MADHKSRRRVGSAAAQPSRAPRCICGGIDLSAGPDVWSSGLVFPLCPTNQPAGRAASSQPHVVWCDTPYPALGGPPVQSRAHVTPSAADVRGSGTALDDTPCRNVEESLTRAAAERAGRLRHQPHGCSRAGCVEFFRARACGLRAPFLRGRARVCEIVLPVCPVSRLLEIRRVLCFSSAHARLKWARPCVRDRFSRPRFARRACPARARLRLSLRPACSFAFSLLTRLAFVFVGAARR
ncbi:hypothetical protein EXIGLDRAFT_734316 [Exidia glandulosa HHB12029]|uniref:Uncharacterized protein n=1 Tax=Exidia glandulosa HHB12029 TaxID=1314781 RepID=A0A165B3G4_EXIGL|nr:hypothetical protein EXIGLDRAFT_734316 [Exidia glandulosa HHB12029]